MMHEPEKSDSVVVAAKPTNKAVRSAAEPVERTRLHQLNAICAILGASDRDKSLDLRGLGLRKRL
jgi:hypothetical protein